MSNSAAIEDYVKAVYAIASERQGPVLNGEVAHRLAVTPATATTMLKKLAERGDIDPDERVVVLITGEGLKTLDAVRGSFETHEIEPTVDAFERDVEHAPTAVSA